jgi:hypothetical protein
MGPFSFLGGVFLVGEFTQTYRDVEIVLIPYAGLLEDFVGSLAQDQEKALVTYSLSFDE